MSGVDRRTPLAAALAAALLLGASQPAFAPDETNVVRPDDRRLSDEGHWGRTAEAATTVNSGSRLRFRFTGGSVHALFDVTSITVPAQIYVSVDGGPKRLHAVDRRDLEITADGRGAHSVEISVKDVFSRANRWTPPLETGVVLTGLRPDAGGRLLRQPARPAPKLAFYGDSITQGVMALCEVNTSDCADGTAACPTLVADALRASLTQVGFVRQGVIQTGNGAWDGDKASENLDFTHVEKWDPATETSTKIFEPSGVVSGPRNATPFYGDIVGDWREEFLAETTDHTALRLYTTTEPTSTRLYTLAQNPEYRLGWTVRGYLQSTYTDYYLGTETRRVPKPTITLPEGAVSRDDHA